MQIARSSGILLHISSLSGPYGIGNLGPAAHTFIEYLSEAGQAVWQVLPLVPIGYGYSPYSGTSTFAGNTLFISPEVLIEDGLLTHADMREGEETASDQIDYPTVVESRQRILRTAHARFRRGAAPSADDRFGAYCRQESHWLSDYALFTALKEELGGGAWTSWPTSLALREPDALEDARHRLAESIEVHSFAQFLFDEQWRRLREHAAARSIRIFGDLPIYVAHDSADVWSNPGLFHLRDDGTPRVVAGVPPDYFSQTGQRWGNPLYRWDVMAQSGYSWWLQRFERSFELVDLLRIDHFRGFQSYWEIPSSEPTAVNGEWVLGPGAAIFHAVEQKLGPLPIVAEDLGIITPDVTALMVELGFPGMAVLQFAFGGGADSAYLPHNYIQNLVAYTGTHDNDTMAGWYTARANAPAGSDDAAEFEFAQAYLQLDSDDFRWKVLRWMMASVASLVVFPMQDVLGLGAGARMNVPGLEEGNWSWRMSSEQLRAEDAVRLRKMVELYGREWN